MASAPGIAGIQIEDNSIAWTAEGPDLPLGAGTIRVNSVSFLRAVASLARQYRWWSISSLDSLCTGASPRDELTRIRTTFHDDRGTS